MGEAADMLRSAGHTQLADLVSREVVGRNVLDGRWTYQVIEEFEAIYYDPIRTVEKQVRDELMAGRRHVYEAEMKEQRRTTGASAHEARPPAAHDQRVVTNPPHVWAAVSRVDIGATVEEVFATLAVGPRPAPRARLARDVLGAQGM